ncbi:DNA repair protein [Devosia geojensis]|uniref:DNA repair protein n=1 Tax=Devosia geojensis TaxID=443610 RepID=A0A0F5FQ78_9HYPH|nr:alpha-ketoglutarate-dependent dioxygenase AlkB [Devosia geojensis]KKB10988.1 DNA repair protein [Devosia geojensis]
MIPPAAAYIGQYVTEPTEAALIEHIDGMPWLGDLRRRVQHYGYRYDYRARRVTRDSYLGPLPDWLDALARQLAVEGKYPRPPDQVIVNEYLPGQGIAAHVDCEPCFGQVVASLSLGSTCVMEFTDVRSGEMLTHPLERRSLLVLKDEARFTWKHGIPARRSDVIDGVATPRGRRVSLTFRTVVRGD